jgi:hypothetical protein
MANVAQVARLKATRIGICSRPQASLVVEYEDLATAKHRLWRVSLKSCVANRAAEDITNSIFKLLPVGLDPSSLNHDQIRKMVTTLKSKLVANNRRQEGGQNFGTLCSIRCIQRLPTCLAMLKYEAFVKTLELFEHIKPTSKYFPIWFCSIGPAWQFESTHTMQQHPHSTCVWHCVLCSNRGCRMRTSSHDLDAHTASVTPTKAWNISLFLKCAALVEQNRYKPATPLESHACGDCSSKGCS